MSSNFTYTKHENKVCAGNGCKNNATILLKIEYIRKTGYFCNTCARDLLQLGLARV